mmetsp:Transcript_105817/g.129106  ORF Transcript_105817/g.129106 Transcript_105817/m.129106 type:complete len:97 (-) Transcript_105817:86-376(-)
MSLYLRFKRDDTTVFLSCKPNDDLDIIKLKLCEAINKNGNDIRLFDDNEQLLDEEKTINGNKLLNDDIIHYTFKINDNEWENIQISNNNQSNKAKH